MDLDSYQPQVVPHGHDPLQIQTTNLAGQLLDLEDLGPQPRDRCNTWPLQRPSGDLSHNTSPLIHEEIPEEGSQHGSIDSVALNGGHQSPDSSRPPSPAVSFNQDELGSTEALGTAKKNSARRNAWGNMSYADLITQAIINSPDKRLTLSQIYDWMVQNVPYFRDKGDSNSSAGWKLERMEETLNNSEMDALASLEPIQRERCYTWPLNSVLEDTPSTSATLPSEALQTAAGENPLSKKPKAKKKSDSSTGQSKKPNPWGEESYADLIAKALESAPMQRMKLNEIYQWFIENNAYFQERKEGEVSAGWKNSIRHNLSLHSRFMRIQNEGAGKSSWWVINPDAKPGKASRRRAQTMDTKPMEKKRRGAKNKVDKLRAAALANAQAAASGGDLSPVVSSDSSDAFSLQGFRPRSNSNLSNYSTTGRLSPPIEDLFDDSPWGPRQQELNCELLEMATSMRLGDPNGVSVTGGFLSDSKPPPPSYSQATSRVPFSAQSAVLQQHSPLKIEPRSAAPCSLMGPRGADLSPPFRQHPVPSGLTPIKQEPPAYQELYPTTYGKIQGNPALREALKSSNHGPSVRGFYGEGGNGGYQSGLYCQHGPPTTTNGTLPHDIQDVHYDTNLQCDINAVIQHELSVAGNLDFNMDTYGNC